MLSRSRHSPNRLLCGVVFGVFAILSVWFVCDHFYHFICCVVCQRPAYFGLEFSIKLVIFTVIQHFWPAYLEFSITLAIFVLYCFRLVYWKIYITLVIFILYHFTPVYFDLDASVILFFIYLPQNFMMLVQYRIWSFLKLESLHGPDYVSLLTKTFYSVYVCMYVCIYI